MPNRQADVLLLIVYIAAEVSFYVCRKPGDTAGTYVASDLCLPLHGRYSLLSFSGMSLNRFRNVLFIGRKPCQTVKVNTKFGW